MKKILLAIVMLAIISMSAMPAMAIDRPNLKVTLLSYTPVPAEPGSYVTVTLKVANNGAASTTNAAIEFVDNYPFSVDAQKKKSIGALDPQQDFLAEYRVRVNSAAVEGTNYLKVRYTTDQENWVEKEIALTIDSVQKTLGINSVTITPNIMTPGEQATAVFKIKNLGSSDLRDVSLRLNLEGTMVGSTYVDIPLAPIGSSVEKRLSLLATGQTADFEFVLQAYPEAAAGIYKVPITLRYTDDAGKEYSRTDLFGVAINSETEILTQIDSSTLYSDNGKGDVTVSVTNKGLSELKFVTISLVDTDDYSIKSLSNEVYVGNIDSDDYELATFSVKMDKQGKNQVTLPIQISYKDSLNNEYTMKEDLSLDLISTADAGNEKSNTGTIIIVIVVVVVIGFILLRRRKHKKKK